jgi:hypothetical protein
MQDRLVVPWVTVDDGHCHRISDEFSFLPQIDGVADDATGVNVLNGGAVHLPSWRDAP